jgi:hypothetical protein
VSDCSLTKTFSRKRSLGTALLVFSFAFFGAAPVCAAPGVAPVEVGRAAKLDLDLLLASFAGMPGFEARFEENKTLSLLAVPLRSEGRLFYSPSQNAQRLLRRVESPNAQDILISDNAIRIREGGREEVIDLNARAEVRPLVESLLWIFSGDREALEAAFVVDFETSAVESAAPRTAEIPWRLLLEPRNESLRALIDRLEISGSGLGADRITVFESGGDRSVMRVFEANRNRHFSEAEESNLFGRGPTSPAADDD